MPILAAALAGCSREPTVQSALSPASPDARLLETLSLWLFGVGGTVLVVVLAILLYVVLARRGPGDVAPLSTARSWQLVLGGGIVAPALAILGVVASGLYVGDRTEAGPVSGDPAVEIVGKRWWWEVRYLDPAGEMIAVTANEIHLPAGVRTPVLLSSDNVIHSFWAPALQGKTDMIPGRTNATWFEPAAPGVYRGQCAEFCGVQHALMAFLVIAEPEEDFRAWLADQARDAAPVEDPVAAAGRQVFFDQGCDGCHAVRGTEADGEAGPDLTHFASRRTIASGTLPNTRGNLGGWVTNPQHVKPGVLMPPSLFEPEELRALLTYLGTLR